MQSNFRREHLEEKKILCLLIINYIEITFKWAFIKLNENEIYTGVDLIFYTIPEPWLLSNFFLRIEGARIF